MSEQSCCARFLCFKSFTKIKLSPPYFNREGVVSEEEAQALIEQAEKDMLAHKNKMDLDRTKQEQELHKKLSERKKKRRAEVEKKHAQELKELEKKHQDIQTKDGYCGKLSSSRKLVKQTVT